MIFASSIGDEFAALLGGVVGVALRLLIFLAIIGVGWLIGTWLRRWSAALLGRTGFDRLVQRGGLHRVLGQTSPSDLAGRLIAFAFLLFVLELAFGVFGPNAITELIKSFIAWLPSLFVALLIIVVSAALAGWVCDLIVSSLAGLSYARTLGTTVQVLIMIVATIASLNQVGVAESVTLPLLIAALAAVVGVIVVGVGGGLIRPMQQRWDRVLDRAEAQTTLAAEHLRNRRVRDTDTVEDVVAAGRDAGRRDAGRNVPGPSSVYQSAYGGERRSDVKPEGQPAPPRPDATAQLPRDSGELGG